MSLLMTVLFPMVFGVFIGFIKDNKKRNILTSCVLFVSILMVIYNIVKRPEKIQLFTIYKNLNISLFCDEFSVFFSLLFSIIWFLVAFFAYWYIPHAKRERAFFSVYTISLGSLLALSYSANLVTFYMFFEMMSMVTMLMVIHERTKESYIAGYTYLGYSVFGAGLGLLGLMFLNDFLGGNLEFTKGGNLDPAAILGRENLVLFIVLIMVIGFAGKAGMYPLHSWLPVAHPVAPAPASAVLSGLITKAGVLGVIRLIYNLVGPDFLRGTWVQMALLIISLTTVFLGSMLALRTNLLKRRLAYSSVSQVSYALFGIFILTNEGLKGALEQIVYHAISKNLLFLCAGAIIVVFGKTKAKELKGLGKKMPFTLLIFTLASLNLIGIPPMGGFFSKWDLATAAIKGDIGILGYIGPVVLLISAILTAGYLLPITVNGFLKDKEENL